MVSLIQLTSLDSCLSFGNKRFSFDLLPVSTIAQSDRGAEFANRYFEKLWQFIVVQHSVTGRGFPVDSNEDRAKSITEALMLDGKLSRVKNSTLAQEIGIGNAHKQYRYLNQMALDREITVIEWLLAVMLYVRFYDTRRGMFAEHQDAKKNEAKIQRFKTQRDSILQKIVNVQKVIDDNTRYLAAWNEKLEAVESEIDELSSE